MVAGEAGVPDEQSREKAHMILADPGPSCADCGGPANARVGYRLVCDDCMEKNVAWKPDPTLRWTRVGDIVTVTRA